MSINNITFSLHADTAAARAGVSSGSEIISDSLKVTQMGGSRTRTAVRGAGLSSFSRCCSFWPAYPHCQPLSQTKAVQASALTQALPPRARFPGTRWRGRSLLLFGFLRLCHTSSASRSGWSAVFAGSPRMNPPERRDGSCGCFSP